MGNIDLSKIREFVEAYDARAPELDLAPADAAEAQAEVATIRAQIESPKPKLHFLRESRDSLLRLLEGAGGGLAAAHLIEMLQHVNI